MNDDPIPDLVIDPVHESDLPEVNRFVNEPEIARYLDLVPPVSLSRTYDFFRYLQDQGGAWWALRVDGVLAGSVGLIPGDPASRLGHAASVFIYIDTPWWGRGIGSRGIRAIADEARRRGVVRLEALVVDENERSLRLFRSAGFEHEAVRHLGFRADDGYRDLVQLVLLLD
jgi:RimJ/RimL family protein N-acetyltransferase